MWEKQVCHGDINRANWWKDAHLFYCVVLLTGICFQMHGRLVLLFLREMSNCLCMMAVLHCRILTRFCGVSIGQYLGWQVFCDLLLRCYHKGTWPHARKGTLCKCRCSWPHATVECEGVLPHANNGMCSEHKGTWHHVSNTSSRTCHDVKKRGIAKINVHCLPWLFCCSLIDMRGCL